MLIFFALISSPAFPDTIVSATQGSWNVSSTWSGGVVPSQTDIIKVAHHLELDINIILSGEGSLTVDSLSSLSGNMSITVSTDGSLFVLGITECKKITNNGYIFNKGTIITSGNFDNNGTLVNDGSITVEGNFINNGGTVTGNNGAIYLGNNLINNASGYISNQFICSTDGYSDPLISNSGSIDTATVIICSQPLAVEMYYFEAVASGESIVFHWATLNEENSSHFDLERSMNGEEFTFLKRIQASGFSNRLQCYSATDESPFSGTSFYRLKQVDTDGSFEFTEVISVEIGRLSDWESFYLFPNPCKDYFLAFIGNNIPEGEQVKVEIRDISGVLVLSSEFSTRKNGAIEMINIDEMPSGLLFVSAVAGKNSFIRRIVHRK